MRKSAYFLAYRWASSSLLNVLIWGAKSGSFSTVISTENLGSPVETPSIDVSMLDMYISISTPSIAGMPPVPNPPPKTAASGLPGTPHSLIRFDFDFRRVMLISI